MSNTRHIGKVQISLELLLDNFRFPEGTEIIAIDANSTDIQIHKRFTVYLEHSDLPKVGEYEQVPIIEPTYQTKNYYEFDSWNCK